jgi:hypothetical protein
MTGHEFHYDPHGEHGPTVTCTCGWSFHHPRAKVIGKAATRHAEKVKKR